MKNIKSLFLVIEIFLIGFAVIVVYCHVVDKSVLRYYLYEDCASENITVVFYFLASYCFFRCWWLVRNKFYLFLSILCFFIGAEFNL